MPSFKETTDKRADNIDALETIGIFLSTIFLAIVLYFVEVL